MKKMFSQIKLLFLTMPDGLVVNRYVSPKLNMYDINNTLICVLNNEHEFNNMRIQLLKKGLNNKYYFIWNNNGDLLKITLDESGNMSSFPRGLYDQVQRDLYEIIMLKK